MLLAINYPSLFLKIVVLIQSLPGFCHLNVAQILISNRALQHSFFLKFKSQLRKRQNDHTSVTIKSKRLTQPWKRANLQTSISMPTVRASLSSAGCRWVIYSKDRTISLVTMQQASLTSRQKSKGVVVYCITAMMDHSTDSPERDNSFLAKVVTISCHPSTDLPLQHIVPASKS